MFTSNVEIPMYINGEDIRSNEKVKINPPHDHKKIVGEYFLASPKNIDYAIESALAAKESWSSMSWENRSAVFLKAAELIAGHTGTKLMRQQ